MALAGRPPARNPRVKRFGLVMTVDEDNMLRSLADRMGMTKRDVIIRGLERLKRTYQRQDRIAAEAEGGRQ